ncbi:MAG: DUF362 domain-containing protein [Methanocellales archaeon]|nr:DUF362 domain-containing protein [Methanocellales archaeon]MDD3291516.1 DUF362 domain-containing protein [Methanocellales archaeon]MDD5234594.1 DUF362 domain-containing protein [Methanocellales archaeon]MDD5485053.1 DUF362 domain-containing protein [Methanocellales archaeon]
MEISRRNLLKMLGIAGGAAVVGGVGGYASRGSGAGAEAENWPAKWRVEDYYAVVERKPIPPKATVWWADPDSAGSGKSWPEKIAHVYDNAGFEDCIDKGDTVAIKLHTGERNRTAQLRPDLCRAVANRIIQAGGQPFAADTLTAYGGKTTTRQSIKNHMVTALSHGLVPEATNCPVIPYCDGDGSDHVAVKIDGNQLTVALVAKLLAEADAMIVLTHGKGHGSGMFGGAIKNLGIGGASKQGKVLDHVRFAGRYANPRMMTMDVSKCPGKNACPVYGDRIVQNCIDWCPWGALTFDAAGKLVQNVEMCNTICRNSVCDTCTTITNNGCAVTMKDATTPMPSARVQRAVCQIRYADTAVAVHNCFAPGKVGYITVGKEVCRQCDCAGYDDQPIVPNMGVYSTWDLAAGDAAELDMITASDVCPGSMADDKGLGPGDEKFEPVNGQSPWFQVYAVEKLGHGTTSYTLEQVDEPWLFPWFNTPQYEWDYGASYRSLIPMPPDQLMERGWYYDE